MHQNTSWTPEHELDVSPRPVWDLESYVSKFLIVLLDDPGIPIGKIYVGGPPYYTDVAWWLDSKYRRRGYGS
jgi:RimJ/RimL family protein N-acetyltransferase